MNYALDNAGTLHAYMLISLEKLAYYTRKKRIIKNERKQCYLTCDVTIQTNVRVESKRLPKSFSLLTELIL